MAKGITAQEMDATTASGLVPHLGTTTNSGNSYSVTSNTAISTNQKFTIKFNVASSTAPTLKINNDTALPIKNANGNNAKLYASVYTLFQDGSAFILLGEGGEYGTVAAADVLTGKTFGTDNGLVNGTMPDRSSENNHMPGLESTVWAGDRFFIRPPHGYFNGSTWVTAAVPGLTANNLRSGVNVGGLIGTLVEGVKYARGGTGISIPSGGSVNIDCGFVPRAFACSSLRVDMGARTTLSLVFAEGMGRYSYFSEVGIYLKVPVLTQVITVSSYSGDHTDIIWHAWA